ncbi:MULTISPECIES: hypothetical protein [Streptomyces]|uniref:DUF3558 domain-containing protein n=1 Tax=Streptomyces demainii TaxID=588122 RepID=A0ABT9KPW2_9ACTN|nr:MULTISPECIES: hypothetical protein [Streptomyces]MCO8303526.1 hypothetical protein [Streptomyces sp. RKCA744]MDP9610481.1 hypothetical protein [Streptomyces demainii]
MRSLPLTLAARLLPVVVLAAAGVAMTTSDDSDAHATPAGPSPQPSATATGSAAPRHTKPPTEACATLPASLIKELVPGAKAAGNELKSSDLSRRTGCNWHALDGFDYRWLDVAYDVRSVAATPSGGGSAVPGLGDNASVSEKTTDDDGQGIREAVVTVHQDNATVTVTYNGGDFESHKAADADAIRKGAISAAKEAVAALDG